MVNHFLLIKDYICRATIMVRIKLIALALTVAVIATSSTALAQQSTKDTHEGTKEQSMNEGQEGKLDIVKLEQELTKYHVDFLRQRMKEENTVISGGEASQNLVKIKQKQIEIVEKVIREYNLNKYANKFAKIISKFGQQQGTSLILRKFSNIFIALRDFYFEYGELLVEELDKSLAKKAFKASNPEDELKRKFEQQTKPSIFGFTAFLE